MTVASSAGFSRLIGLTEAEAQLKALPAESIEAFGQAAFRSAQLIAVRARTKAPVRRTAVGSYTGGALRDRIGAALRKSTGTAVVGIEQGVLVVRTSGLTRIDTKGPMRVSIDRTGKRHVSRAFLSREEREGFGGIGVRVIQPTRYGHFSELGRGGRRGGSAARPWEEPAVTSSVDYMETQMRQTAQDCEQQLAVRGYRP